MRQLSDLNMFDEDSAVSLHLLAWTPGKHDADTWLEAHRSPKRCMSGWLCSRARTLQEPTKVSIRPRSGRAY
jgi:hypothetical protein